MVNAVSNSNPKVKSVGHKQAFTEVRKISVSEKPVDLDDVLIHELGQFGRYQLINIVMVSVLIAVAGLVNEYIFSAAAIPHRCRISECGEDSKNNLFEPAWILNAIPTAKTKTGFDSCSRYESQANGTLDYCPASLFTNTITDCNQEFVYARDNGVVSEFNLGCQEWLRALAGFLSACGTLLALPIAGYVSDRFGRKIALILSVFNLALFGLMRAFSINYTMYLVLQLLQTTFANGIFSAGFILASEFVGPRYRVVAGVTCSSMFAIGEMILGAVAWLVQPWRYMLMTLYIPCFFLVGYYWLLSESVRWQLSKKKFAEARVSLEKVARVNKKQISEESMNALLNPPEMSLKSDSQDQQLSLIQAIFKSRVLLRRVLITPICWITTTLVYYGLSINATSLSSTMYLNYILTVGIEVPGFFTSAYLMDKVGRKPTICTGFLASAACNIVFVMIPEDLSALRIATYLLGKFGISMVSTSIYLYTTELYPTPYRHRLVAFSSMVGRIGSITAPLTPVLMQYWSGLPSILFAGMGILSGLLIFTQPETLGIKLPDTLDEAEAIGTPKYTRTVAPE